MDGTLYSQTVKESKLHPPHTTEIKNNEFFHVITTLTRYTYTYMYEGIYIYNILIHLIFVICGGAGAGGADGGHGRDQDSRCSSRSSVVQQEHIHTFIYLNIHTYIHMCNPVDCMHLT